MNENDRLVAEQTGELRMLARVAAALEVKFDIIECRNCKRVTTTGLCGCSYADPEIIYAKTPAT